MVSKNDLVFRITSIRMDQGWSKKDIEVERKRNFRKRVHELENMLRDLRRSLGQRCDHCGRTPCGSACALARLIPIG